MGEQADDVTKRQLAQQAANLGVPVSEQTKEKLIRTLEDRTEE